jgi:hypothetical protein
VLGGGLLSAFFAALPMWRWIGGERDDTPISFVILALFTPMAAVLCGAGWNLLRYAGTGHRRPLLSTGPLFVFGFVVVLLLGSAAFMGIVRGDLGTGVGAIVEGSTLVGWILVVTRARARARERG